MYSSHNGSPSSSPWVPSQLRQRNFGSHLMGRRSTRTETRLPFSRVRARPNHDDESFRVSADYGISTIGHNQRQNFVLTLRLVESCRCHANRIHEYSCDAAPFHRQPASIVEVRTSLHNDIFSINDTDARGHSCPAGFSFATPARDAIAAGTKTSRTSQGLSRRFLTRCALRTAMTHCSLFILNDSPSPKHCRMYVKRWRANVSFEFDFSQYRPDGRLFDFEHKDSTAPGDRHLQPG